MLQPVSSEEDLALIASRTSKKARQAVKAAILGGSNPEMPVFRLDKDPHQKHPQTLSNYVIEVHVFPFHILKSEAKKVKICSFGELSKSRSFPRSGFWK